MSAFECFLMSGFEFRVSAFKRASSDTRYQVVKPAHVSSGILDTAEFKDNALFDLRLTQQAPLVPSTLLD